MVKQKIEEEQATELQAVGTYTFIEPVTFEGVTHSEKPYDLKSLKSTDVISAMNQANQITGPGRPSPDSPMTDSLLHAILFARAADLPACFVLEMGASDFLAWASAAQGFFARALSSLVR